MMRSMITTPLLVLAGASILLAPPDQVHGWDGADLVRTEVVEMTVTGLSCPFCAFGLEKKLTELEGVGEIEIEAATGTVRVELAEGHEVTEERLRSKVRDAGFEVREISRAPWLGATT